MVIEKQRAGLREEPDDAEEKEDIADARGEEGFFRGRGGRGLLIPEADEQIRGEADDLPAHEEQQQAVGDDDAEHGSGKEREEAEEAGEVFVVGHVADGVDEDEQADEGDHHEHDGGERIEHPAEIDGAMLPKRNQVKLTVSRTAAPCAHPRERGANAIERKQQRKASEPMARRCGEFAAAAA